MQDSDFLDGKQTLVCQALDFVDIGVGSIVDLIDNEVLDLVKFDYFFLEGERTCALHNGRFEILCCLQILMSDNDNSIILRCLL